MCQVYESAHSIVGAEDRRDALAKTLYTGAFEWLVARLNESIAANTKHVWGFMGVLDIYGFEVTTTKNGKKLDARGSHVKESIVVCLYSVLAFGTRILR